MNKKLFYFFVLISCFVISGSTAIASIVVEEATIIWEEALVPPTALIEASGKVESRILIEYATVIYKDYLVEPTGLFEASEKVQPRIVVEYAATTYHDNLDKPTELIDASEKVRPRIVVVYAPTVFKADLIYPFDPIPGDFSRNGLIDLGDIVRILKTVCGDTTVSAYKEADISGDAKIGLEDAIYLLREIAR